MKAQKITELCGEHSTAALNSRQESRRSPHKQHLGLRSYFKGPPVHMSRKKRPSRETSGFSQGLGVANTHIHPGFYLVNTN